MALAAACGNNPEENTDNNDHNNGHDGNGNVTTYEIIFDGDGLTPAPVLEADGGSATIGFTSSAEWKAAKDSEVEWLMLNMTSGAAGHSEITVTAIANDSYNERNAAVTITSGNVQKRFTVAQKQRDALTVTSGKVEMTADGGNFEIKLQTNVGNVEYDIYGSAKEWIHHAPAARSLENRTLTFTVDGNGNSQKREGKINIKAGTATETVTVYQSGITPQMVLSQREFTVSSDGGEVKIELQSNIAVKVNEPSASWIKRIETRAMSSYTYVYNVDENTDTDPRTAQIVFTSSDGSAKETVTVTQKQKGALTITSNRLETAAAGGSLDIEFQTNIVGVECEIEEAAREWIALAPATISMEKRTLTFDIKANPDIQPREGAIKLTAEGVSETITVVQSGVEPQLILTQKEFELPAEGGSVKIELQTNAGGADYAIEESAREWISASAEPLSTEHSSFSFDIKANAGMQPREGRIIISAGGVSDTAIISQSGIVPEITLSQTEFSVSADGGEVTVGIQSNVEVEVCMPDDSWISRTDDGSVPESCTFRIDPNTDSKQRKTQIVFSAIDGSAVQTVTVTQRWRITADAFKWANNEKNDGLRRAFPGAEGGGMYTEGGRGGRVIHVTNLNDSGAGSLRDAIEQSGPRTIVFDVAGTIALESKMIILNGDLTIAGQTAPGDGICVKDYTVEVDADNVIIRYMRFRLGDKTAKDESPQEDCIWGRYHENIILDHCSMTWSMDECSSFYANKNFTMQWCLVGESLNNSGHPKGEHGFGGLWGGKNASFHHNLIAHNRSRNARFDHPQIYGPKITLPALPFLETHRGNVDYRNNVVYNWLDQPTHGGEDGWFNMVKNYVKPGPASYDRRYFMQANSYYDVDGLKIQYNYPRLYVEGNVHSKGSSDSRYDFSSNQQKGVSLCDGSGRGDDAGMFLKSPLSIMKDDMMVCYTTTHDASMLLRLMYDYVGASRRRDDVDKHIVKDLLNGNASYPKGSKGSKGGIIDSQKDVGGWPVLTATASEIERVKDTDGDGIPDYYEELFGLDPADASDGDGHKFDSRYTNFEMYLHYLVQETVAGQVSGGVYTELR